MVERVILLTNFCKSPFVSVLVILEEIMDKSKTGFRLFSLIIVIGVLFGLVVPVYAVPLTKANGPENLVAVNPDEVTEMVL